MAEEKGAYSHNLDRGSLNEDSDVRPNGTGEELDEIREQGDGSHGMGREESPREDRGEGVHNRLKDPDSDKNQQINTTEGINETPTPTHNASGSDDVPA